MTAHPSRVRTPLLGAAALLALLLGVGLFVRPRPAPQAAATPTTAASPSVSGAAPAGNIVPAARPAHRVLAGNTTSGTGQPVAPPTPLGEALDAALSFDRRVAALRALPSALDAEAHAALLAAASAPGPVPGLSGPLSYAFKNDSFNALGRQADPARRAEIAARLRSMSVDPAQDAVMRDYALQHLADLGPAVDDGAAHLAALDGAEPALVATSLLHLVGRERFGALTPPMRARAERAALSLAADESAPAPSRATALQVCARLRHAEAAPLALRLAQDTSAPIPLRIAALAALGDLPAGDSAEREFLEHTLAEGETRLRRPAAFALLRLNTYNTTGTATE
jgi:hypothetical protein